LIKTELVPNERLGILFRAVCLSSSDPRRSEDRLMSAMGGKRSLPKRIPIGKLGAN